MSRFKRILVVSPLPDGKTWVIREPFGYDIETTGDPESVEVPVGFLTDFATIPRLFWFVLPKWGKYGNAAVIHDFIYWMQDRSRSEADKIFLEAMGVLKVGGLVKYTIYYAVRAFGWTAWYRNRCDRAEGVERVIDAVPESVTAPVPKRKGALRHLALRTFSRTHSGAWLFLSTMVLITSCASPDGERDGRPLIAASMPPVAALIETVAGEGFRVVSLLPPGRSPHDHEPTPAELKKLRTAVFFVRVGGGLDLWMERVALGLGGDQVSLLTLAGPGDQELDPHLWLDLEVVGEFLPRLRDRLIEVDPEGGDGYRVRTQTMVQNLQQLDAWARNLLAPVSSTPFALMHPAFAGLVNRYDMNLVAVLEKHPHREPSAQALADATRRLEAAGARIIFAESQISQRPARTLAHDIGGKVAILDPLGGPERTGRETCIDLLRWNVNQLAENLNAGSD